MYNEESRGDEEDWEMHRDVISRTIDGVKYVVIIDEEGQYCKFEYSKFLEAIAVENTEPMYGDEIPWSKKEKKEKHESLHPVRRT